MIRITLLLVLLVCTAIVHAQQDKYTLIGEDNNAVIQVHEGRLRYYDKDIYAPYEIHLDGTEIYILKDGERYPCWPFIVEKTEEPEGRKGLQPQWNNIQLQLQEDGVSRESIIEAFDDWVNSQDLVVDNRRFNEKTGEVGYAVRYESRGVRLLLKSPAWLEQRVEKTPVSHEVLLEAARVQFYHRFRYFVGGKGVSVVTSRWIGILTEEHLQELLEGGDIMRVPTLATRQIRQGR